MKARRRVASLILCLAAIFPCLLCSCAAGGSYYADINIEDSPQIVYSVESREEGIETALSIAEKTRGSSLPSTAVEEVSMIADACISHMEQRGISEYDFVSLVALIRDREDDIADFLSKGSYDSSDFYVAADFVGQVSAVVGVSAATLLIYDFTCVYFTYGYEDNMALYEEYGYAHQLRNATMWKDRLDALQNIGEDNASYLLRAALSLVPLFSESGMENLRSSVSAGEASLYMRALGELLSKISMDEGQWHDSFFLLSETGAIRQIDALYETGACDAAAPYLSDLLRFNAAYLTDECDALADALLNEDIAATCRKLLGLWTEEEWGVLDGLLSACDDEESYVAYLEKIGESERYLAYRDSIEASSREEVISGDVDFFEALEGYIGGRSPFAAFVLFEL